MVDEIGQFRFDNTIRVTPADVIGNASDEHRHPFGITGTSDPRHVLSQATRNHADVFASDRAKPEIALGPVIGPQIHRGAKIFNYKRLI